MAAHGETMSIAQSVGLGPGTGLAGTDRLLGPQHDRRAGQRSAIAPSQANMASLTEVMQRHPDDPQAYNMRGAVLGDAGTLDEALSDFNKAISIDPNYAQAYANRGLVYRRER